MKNDQSGLQDYPNLALSILTTREEKPIAVIIPLSDWEKLRSSLQPESPLYKLMDFLSVEAAVASSYIAENDSDIEQQAGTEEIFIRYKNDLCVEVNMFVQEYADRKVLIRLNPKTDGYEFLQQLS
jgi:hypothetical protein